MSLEKSVITTAQRVFEVDVVFVSASPGECFSTNQVVLDDNKRVWIRSRFCLRYDALNSFAAKFWLILPW